MMIGKEWTDLIMHPSRSNASYYLSVTTFVPQSVDRATHYTQQAASTTINQRNAQKRQRMFITSDTDWVAYTHTPLTAAAVLSSRFPPLPPWTVRRKAHKQV